MKLEYAVENKLCAMVKLQDFNIHKLQHFMSV